MMKGMLAECCTGLAVHIDLSVGSTLAPGSSSDKRIDHRLRMKLDPCLRGKPHRCSNSKSSATRRRSTRYSKLRSLLNRKLHLLSHFDVQCRQQRRLLERLFQRVGSEHRTAQLTKRL